MVWYGMVWMYVCTRYATVYCIFLQISPMLYYAMLDDALLYCIVLHHIVIGYLSQYEFDDDEKSLMMMNTIKCQVKLSKECSFGWNEFLPKREHFIYYCTLHIYVYVCVYIYIYICNYLLTYLLTYLITCHRIVIGTHTL